MNRPYKETVEDVKLPVAFGTRLALLALVGLALSLTACRTANNGTPPLSGLSIENAWMVLNVKSNTISYSLEIVNGSSRTRRVLWTQATLHPHTSFILQNADTKTEFVVDFTPYIACGGTWETFVVRPGKRKVLSGQRALAHKHSPLYFWPWDSTKRDPNKGIYREGIVGDKQDSLPVGTYSARVRILVAWWDGHFSYGLEALQDGVLTAPAAFSIQSSN